MIWAQGLGFTVDDINPALPTIRSIYHNSLRFRVLEVMHDLDHQQD